MKCMLLLFTLWVLGAPSIYAQAKPLPQPMIALKAKLLADKKTLVTEPFEKGLAALNAQYVAAIDRMIQAPPRALNVSEIPALQKERDSIAAGEKMPPLDFDGTSTAVKTLRQTYRTQLESMRLKREKEWSGLLVPFLAETSKLMIQAMKNGTLALSEARSVNEEFMKDVEARLIEEPFRVVGEWNITQSNRTQEVWSMSNAAYPYNSIELTTPKGKGKVVPHGGKQHIAAPGNKDWDGERVRP